MSWQGRVEIALWGATLSVALWSGMSWSGGLPPLRANPAPVTAAPGMAQHVPASVLSAAAGAAVERNPFRLERRPAAAAFGSQPEPEFGIEYHPEPEPERPVLVLRGIVGGPPWEALLEGIPDRQGSLLVRSGDVVGELRVRSIGRDTVVVQDADTTWRLTLKTEWP
jgi:hypothetical protein